MGNGSKLLINEHPLQVLPTLATLVGLNEAIFLQQLHYWLENPKVGREYEGRKYVRNSFEEWQKDNFPFWSLPTLKRIVTKLKKDGLINSTGRLNRMPIDRTQWYTIDYDALENRLGDDDMATRKYQNDTMAKCQSDTFAKDQNDTSIVSKRSDTKYQSDTRNNQRLPETTTERGNPLPTKTKGHRVDIFPPSPSQPNGQPAQPVELLADAIADLCKIDRALASNGKLQQIRATTVKLFQKQASLDDVRDFGNWWRSFDWRGQKGSPPTPDQICDEWERFRGAKLNGSRLASLTPDQLAAYKAREAEGQ